MSFLTNYFLGVRVFIWLYFGVSVVLFLGVLIYIKREKIKKVYYKIRFPDRVIKVIVHNKSNIYREYWRIIPDRNDFSLDGKRYLYDNKAVLKENDFFASKNTKGMMEIKIEGNKYNLVDKYKIKNKGRKYPEIHYFFNKPEPIKYDFSKTAVDISSTQLKDFKDNDLISKLLNAQAEANMRTIMLVIMIVNLLVSVGIFAKLMEWI